MKNSIPRFPAMALMLMISASCLAQPYEHAAGVRAGFSSGLNYKFFFRHTVNALEGNVYYNRNGLNLAAYYSWNLEVFNSSQCFLYFGPGLFGGQWDEALSLGLGGQAGLEVVPRKVPLSFAIDWRPLFNLYKDFDVDLVDFGLCIRYRFSI